MSVREGGGTDYSPAYEAGRADGYEFGLADGKSSGFRLGVTVGTVAGAMLTYLFVLFGGLS